MPRLFTAIEIPPDIRARLTLLRGGMQRRTGLQSRIEVHPIIAVRRSVPSRA